MTASISETLAAFARALEPGRMFDHPDPYPLLAELRRLRPIAALDVGGRTLHIVTGYEEASAVLADQRTFVQSSLAQVVLGQSRQARAAKHAALRMTAGRMLVPRTLVGLEPRIESRIGALLDRLEHGGPIDLASALAAPLPALVLADIVGMPPDDHESVLRWSHAVIGAAADRAEGFAASRALRAYLAPIVRARRHAPRNDLISALVGASATGKGFSDDDVLGFLEVLIPAGVEPPAQLLGNLLVALLGDRERYERVRGDRSLVHWAVEETLRWETPIVFVRRRAMHGVGVGAFELPRDAEILVVIGAANRDEAHYVDPDRFDLDRRADDHLSFGYGRHFCLGSQLATLEVRIALNALLDRFPRLRLAAGAPRPEIRGFAFRQPRSIHVEWSG